MHQRRRRPLREDLPPEWFESEHGMRALIGSLVLRSHPDGIALADLRYELGEGEESVERAVEQMLAEGLLRREGEAVFVASVPPRVRVPPPAPARNGALRRRPGQRRSR